MDNIEFNDSAAVDVIRATNNDIHPDDINTNQIGQIGQIVTIGGISRIDTSEINY